MNEQHANFNFELCVIYNMLVALCRSRLAAASVLLPSSAGLLQEVRRDVIQLLCSIFLANLGESEGDGEDKHLQLVGSIACSIFLKNSWDSYCFCCIFVLYVLVHACEKLGIS